jgi:hypothetical protein
VREREAPRRWVIEGQVQGGGDGTITYTLAPHDGGTTFEREFVYDMANPLLALLDRLLLRRRVEAESAEALGLGGFPHFAAHPFIWPKTLGFRMQEIPFSRTVGAGLLTKGLMKALNKDLPVSIAVGLERDGEVLIKPFCPPYYRNMEEAVLAFVDYKYAHGRGTFRDGGAATGWRDGAQVQAGVPSYSDQAIAATIAY